MTRTADTRRTANPATQVRPWLAIGLAGALAGPALAQDARTVTVAMHYTQEQAAPLIECFAAYEEANPGVSVEYQQLSYRDYLQTVLTSRLGGQAPDVYHLYSIWGAQMVDNGVLAEPPEEVASFVEDAYAASTVEAATIDGQLWGVPTEVSVYMLISNMELLREAGYEEPPTTFEELREVAQAVTTRNDQGRIERAGFAFADSAAGSVHPFYISLFSHGQDVYADDFSSTELASAEAVEALSELRSLVADGSTEKAVDGFDFPAGGIGMIVMANWMEADLRAGFGERFDDAVRVSSIPMGEDWRTMQYAFFFGVDAQSDVQDEAWDLIHHVNGPESATAEGGPSCMGAMLDDLGALTANAADNAALGEPGPFKGPFVEALESGRAVTQPNVIQAAEIEGLTAQTVDTVLAGDAEPEAALEDLDRQVGDILFEFY